MFVKLIRDAIVVDFRIAPFGDDDRYPILNGAYRPMTFDERAEYLDRLKSAAGDTKRRAKIIIEELSRRVVRWDIPGAVPSDVEAMAAVPPAFLDALENQVSGYAMTPQGVADEKKSA
jgi:hypothetical protein